MKKNSMGEYKQVHEYYLLVGIVLEKKYSEKNNLEYKVCILVQVMWGMHHLPVAMELLLMHVERSATVCLLLINPIWKMAEMAIKICMVKKKVQTKMSWIVLL